MSTIADVTTTDRRARGKGPLAAIWNGLLAIRLADHRYHGLTRLSRQSDDALAAKGTTRAAEVRRILGATYYL